MTDINELTAKLKAERKASRLWERLDDAARDNAQQMRNIALESLVALDKAEILNADLTEALEAAQSRIAELEARTLTVKLPSLHCGVVQGGHAVMVPYAAGHWFNKTAILEMLSEAGIKLQIEGE